MATHFPTERLRAHLRGKLPFGKLGDSAIAARREGDLYVLHGRSKILGVWAPAYGWIVAARAARVRSVLGSVRGILPDDALLYVYRVLRGDVPREYGDLNEGILRK